ncbi:flagellar P-ring protein precursor FlgI [Pelomonas saccharophila]|uniref:Flagellar P-ring protein n=1 Tax=Roseateles saccharophilus TaxID=304 RepID=A0ABU1YJ36_ROSSA|nr:flagellar basal body P-ring protein FlgI [Roseateles saccharophilus]MDR7268221.1 flagellar P-ring protein precursor FlgI [Roseateles saccharophilus]
MRAALVLSLALVALPAQSQSVRLKDLARVGAQRENALVGYGVVTGLSGSGDSSRSKATRVTLSNLLNRFDLSIASDDIASRNVAVVMVTASLPAYARPGDHVDVSVGSVGDARSLEGGTLLMAPLKGADGRVYVLAQGALTVGGFRHDAQGNQVQKNHPTAGLVSGGGTVEVALQDGPDVQPLLSLVLNQADFGTAGRMADRINESFGADLAEVRDAGAVEVQVPLAYRTKVAHFVRQIEGLAVEPDHHARVVINERTGTLVAGGDVRISPVAVVVGETRVTVTAETAVSQPMLLRSPSSSVRTEVFTNSQLRVQEPVMPKFVPAGPTRVTDLVQLLAKAKTPPRDMISILQAIKAAGALHAELIVQ